MSDRYCPKCHHVCLVVMDGRGGLACSVCAEPWTTSPPPMPKPFVRYSKLPSRLSPKLKTIGNRDNWTCHLCRLPVDPNGAGERQPSVDHLVPRSKGGRNANSNLALAHRGCNMARADGPLPQQEEAA